MGACLLSFTQQLSSRLSVSGTQPSCQPYPNGAILCHSSALTFSAEAPVSHLDCLIPEGAGGESAIYRPRLEGETWGFEFSWGGHTTTGMVLPEDHGLLLWLWGSILHCLQGERTQARRLDEINLLQKKRYVQDLMFLSAFCFRFFPCLLSPPGVYLFSVLDLDVESNYCPQATWKQVSRNGRSKDAIRTD